MAGNGSYIVLPCGHDLHSSTSPFVCQKLSQYWPVLKFTKFAFNSTDCMKSLWKHGTSLYCETRAPSSGHLNVTLTLEPIKSLCTISTMRLVFLAWWSRSVTFRGCAIQSSGGSWSTILFGWAICGTLGGGFPEKPLPFECSVRLAFLLGLCWSFKLHL